MPALLGGVNSLQLQTSIPPSRNSPEQIVGGWHVGCVARLLGCSSTAMGAFVGSAGTRAQKCIDPTAVAALAAASQPAAAARSSPAAVHSATPARCRCNFTPHDQPTAAVWIAALSSESSSEGTTDHPTNCAAPCAAPHAPHCLAVSPARSATAASASLRGSRSLLAAAWFHQLGALRCIAKGAPTMYCKGSCVS